MKYPQTLKSLSDFKLQYMVMLLNEGDFIVSVKERPCTVMAFKVGLFGQNNLWMQTLCTQLLHSFYNF